MRLPAPFSYATAGDMLLMAGGAIFSIAGGVTLPLFLSYFGDMIDSMNDRGNKRSVDYYSVFEVILGGVCFVCCLLGSGLFCAAGERQIRRISSGYMKSILRQEMAWFDSQESGKLAARASTGISSLRRGLGIKFAQLLFSLSMFISGYCLALFKNWKIALVVSAMMPVNSATFLLFFKTQEKADRMQKSSYEDAAGALEEALLALRTVVSFGLEERFSNIFNERLASSARAILTSDLLLGFTFTSVFATFYFTEALGFWYGAKIISDDLDRYGPIACVTGAASCVSGGQVLAVFFTILMSIFSLGQCAPCFAALAQARTSALALEEVVQRTTQIDPNDPNQPSYGDHIDGGIELKNVTFRYPTRTEAVVYSGLDLSIPAGTTVALVGGSGCGKSTIVQILQRFYDIESGSIQVGGRDIREHNLTSLREHVAIVSQEPRLFATSILENIRIGNLNATDQECIEAARQANAHEFITSYPQGYKTFVGEGGGQLSGGQKQRIAIARAVLRKPTILILDEATSALDNESEKVVQAALDKLLESQKRTTIIIAHRLSTIRNADKIVVFEKISDAIGSRIVEEGKHAELLALNGVYATLVHAQSLQVVQDAAEIAGSIEDLPARAASIAALVRSYSQSLSMGSPSKAGSRLSHSLSKMSATKGSADEQELVTYKVKFSRKLSVLKRHPLITTLSLIAALLDGAVMPCYVILFAAFNNTFFQTDSEKMRNDSRTMAIWLCVIGVLSWIIGTMRLSGMLSNTNMIVKELRSDLFQHILHQEIAFFDNPKKGGGAYISDVVAADPKAAATAICNNLVIGASGLSAMVTALIIAFLAAPKLAAVAVGAFFIMAPASVLESQVQMGGQDFNAEDLERGEIDLETTAYVLMESMQNLRTVEAYSLQQFMSGRYDTLLAREQIDGVRRGWYAGAAWGLSQFLQFAAQALILWYGARLVQEGSLDIAGMFRGSMSIMMAAMTFGLGAFFAGDNAAGSRAFSRIFEILDRPSRVDTRDDSGRRITALEREIEFERVNFSYPMRPDSAIYKDLSFTIKKGETVALVGASGCGKSTAVQLLQQFYCLDNDTIFNEVGKPQRPNAGAILIDSDNLYSLNTKSWRRCIGMVQQEPLLFTTSVRENIALGKFGENCTDEEIEAAARMANAHDFITSFGEGYDTFVGTRGGQLSGGQKQRVAIARALIREPSILILDEATSALDAESELAVQAALDKVIAAGQRTTIVIAHRLSTIQKASKIVVLKNDGSGSSVAQVGTHEELMQKTDGVYYQLAKLAIGPKAVL